MRLFQKGLSAVSLSLVLALAASSQAAAQQSASASVKPAALSKVERAPSMNQSAPQKKQEEEGESFAQSKPSGPPNPPPCDEKANPKCKNPTPSKYRD